MRVLHLINNLHREGAQVVVFNLATAAAGGDVRHLVCVREPGGALQAELTAHGVPVFAPERYFGARDTRRSLQFLRRIVQEQSVDLIHAHMADAAFLGWRVARACALPLVITHHGHDLLPNCGTLCRWVYWGLLAAAAHYARRNIAVAPPVAQTLRRRLGLAAQRISVLVNGVPVPPQDRYLRSDRLRTSAPRVVAVGRLVKLKGHAQLIAAAARVVKTLPGARFYIVGDGPLRDSLQALSASLGLTEHVIFTGSVADVPAHLHAADIYVSTSHYEGMPMATLEAMAWGVPVIASDVAGNRAVVRHEETGLLYALEDVEQLAQRIESLLRYPDDALARAHRARDLVEKRYSVSAVAAAYADLYGELLGANRLADTTATV